MKPSAIKKIRERLGYTQKQLGNILVVSDITISRWETGESVPHPGNLQRLISLERDAEWK